MLSSTYEHVCQCIRQIVQLTPKRVHLWKSTEHGPHKSLIVTDDTHCHFLILWSCYFAEIEDSVGPGKSRGEWCCHFEALQAQMIFRIKLDRGIERIHTAIHMNGFIFCTWNDTYRQSFLIIYLLILICNASATKLIFSGCLSVGPSPDRVISRIKLQPNLGHVSCIANELIRFWSNEVQDQRSQGS